MDFGRSLRAKFFASIITTTIWQIWKARCNLVFKGTQLDFQWIAHRAIAHVEEQVFQASKLSNEELFNKLLYSWSSSLLSIFWCILDTGT